MGPNSSLPIATLHQIGQGVGDLLITHLDVDPLVMPQIHWLCNGL